MLQSRRPVSRSFLEPCRPSPTHRAHVLWQNVRAEVSSLGKAGEAASAEEHEDGGVSGGDDVAPPSGKQVLELQAVQGRTRVTPDPTLGLHGHTPHRFAISLGRC